MRGLMMTMLALCAVNTVVQADEAETSSSSSSPSTTETPATGFGAETRNWTALQIGGASASKEERPLPGEVSTKVYERYVQSFTHPIPEKLGRDSFSSSSGGGGGGSK
jgi:hypothetical protein